MSKSPTVFVDFSFVFFCLFCFVLLSVFEAMLLKTKLFYLLGGMDHIQNHFDLYSETLIRASRTATTTRQRPQRGRSCHVITTQ